MYSPAYYYASSIGDILSCGPTHTAVTSLDLVKCNMQVTEYTYMAAKEAREPKTPAVKVPPPSMAISVVVAFVSRSFTLSSIACFIPKYSPPLTTLNLSI